MKSTQKQIILIVSTAYLPLVGGAEIAVREITDRLKGYDFDLVCARLEPILKRREVVGRINVRRVGFGLTLDKYILPFFILFKSLRNYEMIWTVMASYGSLGISWRKFLKLKTPHLLTLQEGDSEKHILSRVGIFYPFWSSIFKKADHIQAISNFLADLAKRHGADGPVSLVPNGISVEKFKNLASDSSLQDPVTIVTTSRLVYKNGIDTLIRAIALIRPEARNPKFETSIKLQILGKGEDEEKLKKLTRKLGVEDIIEFIGHVDPEEIPSHLARADIFVRASRSEGFGNSFIEAMAAGLPTIGTPVGGIVDFIKDPSTHSGQATGLFCEPNNPEDLARKIKEITDNKDLRKKIATNGRKMALENYSWDMIAEKMGKIFKFLIHNS